MKTKQHNKFNFILNIVRHINYMEKNKKKSLYKEEKKTTKTIFKKLKNILVKQK